MPSAYGLTRAKCLASWSAPGGSFHTVTTFSVNTVAEAYRRFVLPHGLDEIVTAGGGPYNPTFIAPLRAALALIPVVTFEDRGWNSSAREASAFAILGYYAYQGWRNTLPRTTGARHAVIAGKLTRSSPDLLS